MVNILKNKASFKNIAIHQICLYFINFHAKDVKINS